MIYTSQDMVNELKLKLEAYTDRVQDESLIRSAIMMHDKNHTNPPAEMLNMFEYYSENILELYSYLLGLKEAKKMSKFQKNFSKGNTTEAKL